MSKGSNSATKDGQDLSGVDWVARARELAPLIVAEAEETDRGRKVTDKVMKALHDAQMYRMLLPRSIGGGEADPKTYMEVLEIVAAADGSTAWSLGQCQGCTFAAAFLDQDAAKNIFGPPNASLVWGPPRGAKAIKVDGGYRVSGTWMFLSGSPHATWIGGHSLVCESDGTPCEDENGDKITRTMLFPISEAKMDDVWHVMGLRGTGSNNYSVTDLFIPEAYSSWRDNAPDRREHGPLYSIPQLTAYGIGFTGIALGLARALLDEFKSLAKEKKPHGGSDVLGESPVIRSRLAQAEGSLCSARAYLVEMIDEYWETLCANEEPTLDLRARLRVSITNAMTVSQQVSNFAFTAAGTNAIFTKNQYERRFRDIYTVAQQGQAHFSNFEYAGQALLGTVPSRRL